MELNNFEDHIDSVILEHGFYYYQDNCVLSLELTGENKYNAMVEGPELYRVDELSRT